MISTDRARLGDPDFRYFVCIGQLISATQAPIEKFDQAVLSACLERD